jgi:hypothetical protein
LIILGLSCKYLLDKRETKALIMTTEEAAEKTEIIKRELINAENEPPSIRISLSACKKDDDYLFKEMAKMDEEVEEIRANESLLFFRTKPKSTHHRSRLNTENTDERPSKPTKKFVLISNCTSKLIIKRIKKKNIKHANSASSKLNTHHLNINTTNRKLCYDLSQSIKEMQ